MTSWLFLIPVFGVPAGAVILHEPVGGRVAAGKKSCPPPGCYFLTWMTPFIHGCGSQW
jgi:hypothetical protein